MFIRVLQLGGINRHRPLQFKLCAYSSLLVKHSLVTRRHSFRVHLVLTILHDVVQIDEVGIALQVRKLNLLRREVTTMLYLRIRKLTWLTIILPLLLVGKKISHTIQI